MSSTTTTNDDSIEATETVSASGQILREDWDMIGRLIDAVADESRVRVDKDGLHIAAVNAKNAAMFDLHVTPDDWECDQSGMIGLAVDDGITDPMAAIKKMDADSIDIEITSDTVTYDGGMEMTVDTVDPDSIRQMPDLPDIEYDARATVNMVDLKEWINSVSSYKSMTVRQDAADLVFVVDDELTNVSKTFKNHCESFGTVESLFSIDMLYSAMNGMLKGQAKQFDAVIAFDDEYPIQIAFDQKQRTESDLHGVYIQAPQISGDK